MEDVPAGIAVEPDDDLRGLARAAGRWCPSSPGRPGPGRRRRGAAPGTAPGAGAPGGAGRSSAARSRRRRAAGSPGRGRGSNGCAVDRPHQRCAPLGSSLMPGMPDPRGRLGIEPRRSWKAKVRVVTACDPVQRLDRPTARPGTDESSCAARTTTNRMHGRGGASAEPVHQGHHGAHRVARRNRRSPRPARPTPASPSPGPPARPAARRRCRSARTAGRSVAAGPARTRTGGRWRRSAAAAGTGPRRPRARGHGDPVDQHDVAEHARPCRSRCTPGTRWSARQRRVTEGSVGGERPVADHQRQVPVAAGATAARRPARRRPGRTRPGRDTRSGR